jgi:hypothetical protein
MDRLITYYKNIKQQIFETETINLPMLRNSCFWLLIRRCASCPRQHYEWCFQMGPLFFDPPPEIVCLLKSFDITEPLQLGSGCHISHNTTICFFIYYGSTSCVCIHKVGYVYRLYTTRNQCIVTLLSRHVSALLGHHQVTKAYNMTSKSSLSNGSVVTIC